MEMHHIWRDRANPLLLIPQWNVPQETTRLIISTPQQMAAVVTYSRLRTNQTQIFCKSPAKRGFYKKSSGGFVLNLL